MFPPERIAPVPRRVRAVLGGATVVDTARALYVWEIPPWPTYYVPLEDVVEGVLTDSGETVSTDQGTATVSTIAVGEHRRKGAARVVRESPIDALRNTVRFEWSALDSWFEEDEEVFVHPRNPYARVDALRSGKHIRVSIDDVVLAETSSPVIVFETGLPPRYYIDRTHVHFEHLEHTDTVTRCPYKGTTSAYWSARIGDAVHEDVAWSYDFPTRQLQPVAGLVSFFNEFVDIDIDGVREERPVTPFSQRRRATR